MARTYWYRVLQSTWGIAIGLTAEVCSEDDYPGAKIEAFKGLALARISPTWGSTSLANRTEMWRYCMVGLQLVSEQMRQVIEARGALTVRVVTLEFVPTDYQDEGLACALAGWLAEEYGFEFIPPPVQFDEVLNRYLFSLPDVAIPPGLLPDG